MSTTFVRWLKAVSIKQGKFSRGELTLLPSDEANLLIGRGLCEIPDLCKVVYKGEGNQKKYVLDWRKLSITFHKNLPKLVPTVVGREIYKMSSPAFEITKP
jgi:hypothetical protein